MKKAIFVAAVLLGCAPSLPAEYVQHRDAAQNAYAKGRFNEAAQAWLEAAKTADTARDRSDARYRAATSYERAGDVQHARDLYSLLANGNSDRAARATFTLADMRVQSGDEPGGYAALEAAIRKYPSSGIANLAYRRYFSWLAARGGDQAVLDYVTRVLPELGSGRSGRAAPLRVRAAPGRTGRNSQGAGRVRCARGTLPIPPRRLLGRRSATWGRV